MMLPPAREVLKNVAAAVGATLLVWLIVVASFAGCVAIVRAVEIGVGR